MRSLVFAALSLSLVACDSGPLNCAALGDELLGLPVFSPVIPVDCGAGGWTETVERLDDQRSVELSRGSSFWSPLIRAHDEGVVVFIGNEMVGFDLEGAETWRTRYASNQRIDASSFVVSAQGRVYLSDRFGSDAKIVTFDAATGQQIRQYIVDYEAASLAPVLALRGEELWMIHDSADPNGDWAMGQYIVSHRSFEGELLESQAVMHPPDDLPQTMGWTQSGVLVMAGGLSVHAPDLATGELMWMVEDAGGDYLNNRVLLGAEDSVVVANAFTPPGGDFFRWQVSAYAAESGTRLWQQEFARSAREEAALSATADGDTLFAATDYSNGERGQPMIAVFDPSGALVAGERLGVFGGATGAATTARGSTIVVGQSAWRQSWEPRYERVYWMRHYDAPLR